MSCFLYYKPGHKQPVTKADVEAWGLSYAIDDPVSSPVRGETPDGGAGFVVADKQRLGSGAPMIHRARQEWREMPGGCWLGWEKDNPPGPDDLARDVLLAGVPLDLADGREWIVPVVRSVTEVGEAECALPAVYTMGADGELVTGGPVARYARLWEETGWCWDAMVSGEEVSDQRAVETCGRVLGANYAVSAFELCQLGVFSQQLLQSPAQLLAVANSYFTFKQWLEDQKKTTESSSETNSSPSPVGVPA